MSEFNSFYDDQFKEQSSLLRRSNNVGATLCASTCGCCYSMVALTVALATSVSYIWLLYASFDIYFRVLSGELNATTPHYIAFVVNMSVFCADVGLGMLVILMACCGCCFVYVNPSK
jgi:hypothetical protein